MSDLEASSSEVGQSQSQSQSQSLRRSHRNTEALPPRQGRPVKRPTASARCGETSAHASSRNDSAALGWSKDWMRVLSAHPSTRRPSWGGTTQQRRYARRAGRWRAAHRFWRTARLPNWPRSFDRTWNHSLPPCACSPGTMPAHVRLSSSGQLWNERCPAPPNETGGILPRGACGGATISRRCVYVL